MRRFTLEEADALIPDLEAIFEAIAELAARAELKARALRALEEAHRPDTAAIAIERAQLQFMAQGLNARLQSIVDLGALPKGVEPALVDFPSVIEGREGYLCWRLGEKSITHWHSAEEGFSGRKPLPKRKPS